MTKLTTKKLPQRLAKELKECRDKKKCWLCGGIAIKNKKICVMGVRGPIALTPLCRNHLESYEGRQTLKRSLEKYIKEG